MGSLYVVFPFETGSVGTLAFYLARLVRSPMNWREEATDPQTIHREQTSPQLLENRLWFRLYRRKRASKSDVHTMYSRQPPLFDALPTRSSCRANPFPASLSVLLSLLPAGQRCGSES